MNNAVTVCNLLSPAHQILRAVQWRQADSIRHLGKVTLAQEQDYTGLVVGCLCVSLLLLLLGTLLMWRRSKHVDGESRRMTPPQPSLCFTRTAF